MLCSALLCSALLCSALLCSLKYTFKFKAVNLFSPNYENIGRFYFSPFDIRYCVTFQHIDIICRTSVFDARGYDR